MLSPSVRIPAEGVCLFPALRVNVCKKIIIKKKARAVRATGPGVCLSLMSPPKRRRRWRQTPDVPLSDGRSHAHSTTSLGSVCEISKNGNNIRTIQD